jgi:palmitoyltransferase
MKMYLKYLHIIYLLLFPILQIEQINQKALKRERTVEYVIGKTYNGSWLPLRMGWRVCVNFPCTDEPRISIKVGDRVLVTRWKK